MWFEAFSILFCLSHNFLWEISQILPSDKVRPRIGVFLYKTQPTMDELQNEKHMKLVFVYKIMLNSRFQLIKKNFDPKDQSFAVFRYQHKIKPNSYQ